METMMPEPTPKTPKTATDDAQSVTIIRDEQGIVFLVDAGTIDLWLKNEGFDSKAFTAKVIQTVSSASKGTQAAGNAMAESSSPKNRPNWLPNTARTARKDRFKPALHDNRMDASLNI